MYHDWKISRAVSVPLLLLACGCAGPMQAYSGEPRPSEEVARIEGWWQWRWGGALQTFVVAVDGRYLGDHPSADVLPGKHSVKVALRLTEGNDRITFQPPDEMVFHAEAGGTYQLKAFAPSAITEGQHVAGFWIEDKASKQVMVGTKPGESPVEQPVLAQVRAGVPIPGETMGSTELQRDTLDNILTTWEARFAPDCSEHEVIGTRLLQRPLVNEAGRMVMDEQGRMIGHWVERWTLDRCGTIVHYRVTYIPDGQGGTFIRTELQEMPE